MNPPADREAAAGRPQVVLGNGGAQALIGARTECPTLPDPVAFRYVLLIAGGRAFAGYLWEETT